jgi:hypothetical protein
MMMHEREFILSEIKILEDMIRDIPRERIIDRMSINYRIIEIQKKIMNLT